MTLEDALILTGSAAWLVGISAGGCLAILGARAAGLYLGGRADHWVRQRRAGHTDAGGWTSTDPVSGEVRRPATALPLFSVRVNCLVCGDTVGIDYRARDIDAALAELRADAIANGWQRAIGNRMVCPTCSPVVIDK